MKVNYIIIKIPPVTAFIKAATGGRGLFGFESFNFLGVREESFQVANPTLEEQGGRDVIQDIMPCKEYFVYISALNTLNFSLLDAKRHPLV